MDAARQINRKPTNGGPNPGLLRPPIIFLCAILLGIALSRAWPLRFVSPGVRLLGPVVTACAVVLFLLSYREFGRAGTSVRGSERSTTIVRTGPYRFSRNPIYLAFILLVLGLSLWLNNLWLSRRLTSPRDRMGAGQAGARRAWLPGQDSNLQPSG